MAPQGIVDTSSAGIRRRQTPRGRCYSRGALASVVPKLLRSSRHFFLKLYPWGLLAEPRYTPGYNDSRLQRS